jgi:hypothetical protein
MRGPQKAELPGESKGHAKLTSEAEVHETGEGAGPKEVSEMHEPAELESGWTGWEAPTTADTQMSESDQVEPGPSVERGEVKVQSVAKPQEPPAVSPTEFKKRVTPSGLWWCASRSQRLETSSIAATKFALNSGV